MSELVPTDEVEISVLVAVGPRHNLVPPAIDSALRALEGRSDAELIVTDDRAPSTLRTVLATLNGPVRIRHNSSLAFGTSTAAVAGALVARGEIWLVARADTDIAPDALTRVLAAFHADPALGLVVGTDEDDAPSSLYAVRRGLADLLGGPAALELGELEAAAGTVVPHSLSDAVASGAAGALALPLARRSSRTVTSWPSEATVAAALTPPLVDPPKREARSRNGLNVFGPLEAACGLGDAARRYVDAIESSNIDYATYTFHIPSSPPSHFDQRGPRSIHYDINLFAINPELIAELASCGGLELWKDRYAIGIWFWELEEISQIHRDGARFVNEVWVATRFLNDAYTKSIDREVVTVPLPVRVRDGLPRIDRAAIGLPNAFVFLALFDFDSIETRKNALGAVAAFTRAFAPGEGPVLVVKTLNGEKNRAASTALDAAVAGRRDIIRIDAHLPDDAVAALIGHADCFVSLHRAEGFGLSLADAMAWGRPVIATAYSGNLEYMTTQNSYLVDYDKVEVPDALTHFYPRGALWAEPRIEHAAELLRRVFDNQVEAVARGVRAQRDIRSSNSVAAATRVIEGRVSFIADLRARARRQRAGRPSAPATRRPSRARR